MSMQAMRYPAIPLIVHDPYFSIWSFDDKLSENWAHHWTGSSIGLAGLIRIDGKGYCFCGAVREAPQLEQLSEEVLPTRTIYCFAGGGVKFTLTFLTPALLHKLEILSRPVTYICYDLVSSDGRAHEVEIYFDFGGESCVDQTSDPIVWSRFLHPEFDLLSMAAANQLPLGKCGDNLRIDWGRLYLALPRGQFRQAVAPNYEMRCNFIASGTLPDADCLEMPQPVRFDWVSMAGVVDLEVPADGKTASSWFAVGYDDVWSIEYLYRKLPAYWRNTIPDFSSLLSAAYREYAALRAECEAYDTEWMRDMSAAGGEKFARIGALAFRQAIGAHKVVTNLDGTALFFSKENFSNGCIATVDVTYPSAPLFLFAQPELLKGMLIPILDYAGSRRWKFPFAPHDLGTYPLANGQVYGGGERFEKDQMPVEECGNMLILAGALLKFHEDLAFVEKYRGTLRTWAEYLLDKGYDPENQLCTDDFAGHFAHNANLSLKAILALGAYSQIAAALGDAAEAEKFRAAAQSAADRWSVDALDGDHYKLAFDRAGSWSQKYNLVWDRLLGLHLFSPEIATREVAFYRTKLEKYGLPLDNRRSYTKLDWEFWTATLTGDADDFATLTEPIYRWVCETPTRVPLTDWYDTIDGRQSGFQARSVVGGVFLPMLNDAALCAKYAAKCAKK